MNVMLLAAGEGARLRPFTETTPKPAIPFLTVPLAFYSLSLLDRIPIDRLVVNTFHLPVQVKKLFKEARKQWKSLEFSSEEAELLDSGGGVHQAFNRLKGHGDFFVINGDEVILPHHPGILEEMISFHKWHKGVATLLTMKHQEVGGKFGGVWMGEGTKVQCFSKKQPVGMSAPKGLHYIGVLLLSEKISAYFKPNIEKENLLYDTLTAAIQDGQEVHAFECEAEWFETGNPADFLQATEYCLDTLSHPQSAIPYWKDHLKQTIRLYGESHHLVEREWNRLQELQWLIKNIRQGA